MEALIDPDFYGSFFVERSQWRACFSSLKPLVMYPVLVVILDEQSIYFSCDSL